MLDEMNLYRSSHIPHAILHDFNVFIFTFFKKVTYDVKII
jgi:hypothetical protein